MTTDLFNVISNFSAKKIGFFSRTYELSVLTLKFLINHPVDSTMFLLKIPTVIFNPRYAGSAAGEFLKKIIN